MKKTAQELHIAELVKMANETPSMRAHLMPIIKEFSQPASVRYAKEVKQAFSEESEQFVAWALMKDDKWSAAECQRVLDRIGVPFIETLDAPKRGPLEKGEQVKCNALTNASAKNTDVCEQFDGKVGNVVDFDGDAVIVEFSDGVRNFGKGRFEGKTPGKETGLGRYKATPESEKRANFEVIYISDKDAKPPTDLSLKRVQDYVDKGMAAGESRADIYHVGHVTVQTTNKDKQYYFKFVSLTRDNDFRSINPIKGKVLYIGLLGKRPGGWKNEFAKMVAESSEEK